MKKTMGTSQLFLLTLLLLLSLSCVSQSERCHPNDKKALLQIQKDLKNLNGRISWKAETDCCEWSEVRCGDTNRIIDLSLSTANLNLPIPAAVGGLPYLEFLTLHELNLTGPVPRAISNLSQLHNLDLRLNLLTGSVPAFLGHLKQLRYIGLSDNRFTGSIPASLSQLPLLGALLLFRNSLIGSIPETFADLKNVNTALYLSDNQLSGTIPRKLGYSNFSWIDVSRNKLSGDISFLFGKNKSLVIGYFSRNQFEFDLSNVEFSESLSNLDLSQNKIYGSLPKDLSSTGIIALNVSYNRLCGPIPELRRFQTFDVTAFSHNKCLCGKPLPPCK